MSQEQINLLLQKINSTPLRWWQEESFLDETRHTVMHIESVFDIIDWTMEWAAIHDNLETLGFISQLRKQLAKDMNREDW